MKYLTKEWFLRERASYLDMTVKCRKFADKFDERYYQILYKKEYEKFKQTEKGWLEYWSKNVSTETEKYNNEILEIKGSKMRDSYWAVLNK